MKKDFLQELLDTSQPINIFFKLINDGIQYVIKSNTPYTPKQFLQIAYNEVRSSEIYTDACTYWHHNPISDKTWDIFKKFFVLVYNNLLEK